MVMSASAAMSVYDITRQKGKNMFDFDSLEDQELARRVFEEAKAFLGMCHFGVQGIHRTEEDYLAVVNRLKATKMAPLAFDAEMQFIPFLREVFSDYCCPVKLHCAVSYPMGRMLPVTKMKTIDHLRTIGVDDICVCLDWEAVFSGNYGKIEEEARMITNEFQNDFYRVAFVLPATLMSDTKIIDTCKALDAAGIVSIKVNPGAKLGVSFEEVNLIQRKFPNRFDIHASGNIRTLSDILRYREMGLNNIHTASALDCTEEFVMMKLKEYGGI